MEHRSQQNSLYGVEIKLDPLSTTKIRRGTVHVECADLARVLAVLDAHDGDVRIFDRQQRDLVFDGRVEELRQLLWAGVMNPCENTVESTPYRPSAAF